MANATEDFGISKEEMDKVVGEVIRYILCKTHQTSGCPIKREELTQLVTKSYHQRNLPASVINEAKEKLSSIFSYEVRELQRCQPSSKNQIFPTKKFINNLLHCCLGFMVLGIALDLDDVSDSKSYVLISQLPLGAYKQFVVNVNTAHLTGFTFVIVSIVYLAVGKIPEESLWNHMKWMGLCGDEQSHPVLGNVKQALENLVLQRYLQKDRINSPEGNILYYELAERALDGPVNDRIKEYITQVFWKVKIIWSSVGSYIFTSTYSKVSFI